MIECETPARARASRSRVTVTVQVQVDYVLVASAAAASLSIDTADSEQSYSDIICCSLRPGPGPRSPKVAEDSDGREAEHPTGAIGGSIFWQHRGLPDVRHPMRECSPPAGTCHWHSVALPAFIRQPAEQYHWRPHVSVWRCIHS